MGIDSLFVVNNRTESLIAVKHWGAIAGSEICERVFEAHRRGQREGVDGDAACVDQGSYGFYLTRGEVTYVATCSRETAPLMVIEFLSQLYDVLRAYFGESVTETTLQEHHVTLYQLLDEMLDSGIPVNTHAGGLKVLVVPRLRPLIMRLRCGKFSRRGAVPGGNSVNRQPDCAKWSPSPRCRRCRLQPADTAHETRPLQRGNGRYCPYTQPRSSRRLLHELPPWRSPLRAGRRT